MTKTQIGELFRAGRLGRGHRCKPVSQKEWRTVDELFPLLKYQPAVIGWEDFEEASGPSRKAWGLVFAALIATCAILALWYYFSHTPRSTPERYRARVTETRWPRTVSTNSTPDPSTAVTLERDQPAANTVNNYPLPSTSETARVQVAAQQREAQERQRRQAELVRLQQERARQEEKAHGQNVPVPLDEEVTISVGGIPVRVMIHDNDVTSFDVWINGLRRREVPKQKGISQSGTDETFIHNTGRARLYYVWEPSEKVNHCLLRVRED